MIETELDDLSAARFAGQGYLHFPRALAGGVLYDAEHAIADLYRMQAKKCGCEATTLPGILEAMEADDKPALYQVQKLITQSAPVRAVYSELYGLVADLSRWPTDTLLLEGPGLFINRPNTQRLLYKWHSEAHYYPKRRRFVNVWLPLFGNKTGDNGAMSFKVGSHKRDFPFSEYQGYDKDTLGKANHFVQYEIPDNFLTGYQEHVCEAKRGDVIVFDRALVHRSNPNKSNQYSFALVARIWDPSDDLTLSGSMSATPYGGDIGRPGLVVNP